MKTWQQVGDWHTQTIAHGKDTPLLVQATIESAIKQGLERIALTDHYPLPPGFIDPTADKDCAMTMEMYEKEYLPKVVEVKKKFRSKIKIVSGAEFDWLPDYVQWTREQLMTRKFEYTIGSVHFLKDTKGKYWILDYTEKDFLKAVKAFGGIKKLIQAYYVELRKMVKSSLFNTVGHIDLIKKYSSPDKPLFSDKEKWYRDTVKRTLDVIAQSGKNMEVNTAGLDKLCQEAYPSEWIVKEAQKRKILFKIGSDGHTPAEIGKNLDKAVTLLSII